jgi:hypothetical protein
LNGKELNQPWFSHEAIADGGKLEEKANEKWGTDSNITSLSAPPASKTTKNKGYQIVSIDSTGISYVVDD